MDFLLKELVDEGLVDTRAAAWCREHQGAHGGTLESTLLELDLVDEEGLLRALGNAYRMKAATRRDLEQVEPDLGQRLPIELSQSFSLCPLRLEGSTLVVVVEGPLRGDEVQELREVFGLELKQRVAGRHHVLVARQAVYGVALDERASTLEARLARRRNAGDVEAALARITNASSFSAAVGELFGAVASHVDYCCLLAARGDELRVASTAGGGAARTVPMPDVSSSLGAAIRHGGHFFGPLGGTPEDASFFAALSRPVPRWAFVAPIPSSAGATQAISFYADNAERGITPRWVADVTLLLSRLGQRGHKAPSAAPEAEAKPSAREVESADAITEEERAALERLRSAAAEAGTTVAVLVDELLSTRSADAPADPNAALAGEVKGLFEKLAVDIPAQLAQGMQAAFRNMVPQVAAPAAASPPAAPAAASPAQVATPDAGASAAAAQTPVVVQPAKTAREVPSYQSRRRKTNRVKL